MTRNLQIRLEDEEYEAFKKAVEAAGGQSLQAEGRKLVLAYAGLESGPFARLTASEDRILKGILALLQSKSKDPAIIQNQKIVELLSRAVKP